MITSRHVIRLPNGKACGLVTYARAWAAIRKNPGAMYPGWDHYPTYGHQILEKIRSGLQDRISLHLPYYKRGRKWDEYGYQKDMRQSASKLNHPRLVIDWLPPSLADRFAHRLRRNFID